MLPKCHTIWQRMYKRLLQLPKYSYLLLGPRQTGKSTLIDSLYQKKLWKIDLLNHEWLLRYSKNPEQFRKDAEEKIIREKVKTIYVDEVQKVPELLNEIHWLIEHHKACQFVLTGSSARKLKRSHANLLAGRAVQRYLFPLVHEEFAEEFNLDDVLLYGSLPGVIAMPVEQKKDTLNSYTQTYLKEEIMQEALVRNLGNFARFLEVAASQSGELLSYSNIAAECQVPQRTVMAYYEILEDTLLGFKLQPWMKSTRKRLVAHPKFYFFDLGVTNSLNQRLSAKPDPLLRGRLFEQWVILELYRWIHYAASELRIFFWRTNNQAEVDLILEKHGKLIAACEIKSKKHIRSADLSGLRSFAEENPKVPCYLICETLENFTLNDVKIITWQSFLKQIKAWL